MSLRVICAAMFVSLLTMVTPAPARALVRCDPAARTGTITMPVRSAGRDRAVLVHLPATGLEAGAALVFNLHGSGGNGRDQLSSSGLAATSDAQGFVVASPDAGIAAGDGFVWNIPGVPTITGDVPGADAADDVAFLGAVIDTLANELCIDKNRVYATGLSGGGRMTSWLGCVMADRIAAIAPVVGLRAGNPDPVALDRPDPATCNPQRAMPVMTFAGGADTVNPIAGGGARYWQYGLDAALARWAQLDGCATRLPRRWLSVGRYVDEYGGCRGGVPVAAVISVKGGHSWDVADNDAMWQFFARHRLPR